MTSTKSPSRRDFVRISGLAGATLLIPSVVSCLPEKEGDKDKDKDADKDKDGMLKVPKAEPKDWDPISFNRERGNQGAIPKSYLESINGPDGEKKHLGKHLPYSVAKDDLPEDTIAIMWGDPDKGYAKHPNAEKSDELPEGHWYNWIRIRKATDDEATEVESKYSAWPVIGDDDSGSFAAQEGDDPAAEDGKNTIYIAKLPEGVKKGDKIRIYAHCLTHGEYVDFMTV